MKRIFTLILTACTVLSASASDLTFTTEVKGRDIIVNPSSESVEYTVACFNEEDYTYCTETLGLSLDTPEKFLESGYNVSALYHGMQSWVFPQMPDGKYVLVMCADADKNNPDDICIEEVTVDVVPDDDVTFEFSCTGDSFTVTPSNDESKYAVFVITPEQLSSIDVLNVFTYWAYALLNSSVNEEDVLAGKSEFTKADLNITEDGLYAVAVVGAGTYTEWNTTQEKDVDFYGNSTSIYRFDWNVGQNPEAIRTIETSLGRSGKVLEGGKVIINGKVMLDGTLVK